MYRFVDGRRRSGGEHAALWGLYGAGQIRCGKSFFLSFGGRVGTIEAVHLSLNLRGGQ